jgi:type I restriction enzyme S subunit
MKKVKLGDVGKIVTGKTPSTKNPAFFDNDFMFITPEDITNNPSNLVECKRYISKLGLNSIASNSIDGESVVVGCIGSDMGNIGYVKGKCATNQQLNSITEVKKEYDAKFIYYCLKPHKEYFRIIAGSTTTPILPKSVFEKIEIRIPPIATQTKIARILSSLDNKIELNNKINKELENMAKMIYDYWFVQNNNERWERGKLCEIANITMGQSPSGNSYNDKGNGIVFYQGCTDFGVKFPSPRQYTTTPKRYAEIGDILLSVRAPVGRLNFTDTKCCIGRGLAALNSKIGSISHLYFVLKDLQMLFNSRNSIGTVFGSITKDDLFSLSITKPPSDLVEYFENIVNPILNMQFEISRQTDYLSKLRNELLPLLMNGQVKSNDKKK